MLISCETGHNSKDMERIRQIEQSIKALSAQILEYSEEIRDRLTEAMVILKVEAAAFDDDVVIASKTQEASNTSLSTISNKPLTPVNTPIRRRDPHFESNAGSRHGQLLPHNEFDPASLWKNQNNPKNVDPRQLEASFTQSIIVPPAASDPDALSQDYTESEENLAFSYLI